MGYRTARYLVDVKIKSDSIPVVRKAIETKKGKGLARLKHFLEIAYLADDDLLCFRPTEEYTSPYSPMEGDGSVPAIEGKWYESEDIAKWLKLHSEKGGQLIQHSCEGDGAAWGWEFDGKGRLRSLALCSMGKWE
jgi:hypothetical protein